MTTTTDIIEDKPSWLGHIWSSIAATVILTVICCGVYPLVVMGIAQGVFTNKADGSLVKKDGTPTHNPAEAVGSSLLGQKCSAPGYFHPRPSAAGNSAGSSYSSTGGYDPTGSAGTNYGPLNDELINGATIAATTQPTTQPEGLAFDGIRLRTIHFAAENNIPFKLHHAVYALDDKGNYALVAKDEVPVKTFQDAQGNWNDTALVDAFPHPLPANTTMVDGKKPDGYEYDRTVVVADSWAQLIPGDAVTASASGLDPHISPENAEMQKARIAAARNIKPEQVEELIAAHTDGRDLGILGDPGVNVLMLNLVLDAKYPLPAAPTTAPAK